MIPYGKWVILFMPLKSVRRLLNYNKCQLVYKNMSLRSFMYRTWSCTVHCYFFWTYLKYKPKKKKWKANHRASLSFVFFILNSIPTLALHYLSLSILKTMAKLSDKSKNKHMMMVLSPKCWHQQQYCVQAQIKFTAL